MATLSAPLLRSHHRHLPIRSSPRRCPTAAFPRGFAPLEPLSSRALSRTVVRSASTSAAAPEAAEATGDAAPSETAAEEEVKARVVLPTNESSENLLRIRHTVLPLPAISPLPLCFNRHTCPSICYRSVSIADLMLADFVFS